MTKFKKGDIVDRIGKLSEQYRIIDIKGDRYYIQGQQCGAHGLLSISDMDRLCKSVTKKTPGINHHD